MVTAGCYPKAVADPEGFILRKVIVTLLVVALLGTATVRPATAQGRLSLIADTEIEYTLLQFLQPILQAAGVSA